MTRWADSGAMALTGTPEQPLGPPAGLVEGIDRVAALMKANDLLKTDVDVAAKIFKS